MKAYLVTTALLFSVIVLLHGWEMVDRGHVEIEDPIVIVAAAGLAIWGWRLAKQPRSAT